MKNRGEGQGGMYWKDECARLSKLFPIDMFQGGRPEVRALALTILLRDMKAIKAAHRLGGYEAADTIGVKLLEAAIANAQLDDCGPGAWIIPPFGIGTAHVTRFGQHVYDYEVGVAPLLFGRAKIFQGPVGRRSIDKNWEYETREHAIIAFAVWMVNGFDEEPQNAMRVQGELHDNAKPLCSKCRMEVEEEKVDDQDRRLA